MRVLYCLVLAAAACSSPTSSGGTDAGGNDQVDGEVIPVNCGDGTVDPDEECDDGNDNRFDGCRPNCTSVTPIQTPAANTWQYFEIPGTKCIGGGPAGFSVNYNPSA